MRTAHTFSRRVVVAGLALGALTVVATGCGSDDTAGDASTTSAQPAGQIGIVGQWARATAEGAVNGAVYFTIQPSADDTLVGAKVDPSVAAKTEMHQTMEMTPATTVVPGETTMGGGMTMAPVESVPLTGGEDFVFQPGGFHIMLFDLAKPLVVGDHFTLTLTFEKAGTIDVDVPVLDEAP